MNNTQSQTSPWHTREEYLDDEKRDATLGGALLSPRGYLCPRELFSLIVFPYNFRTNYIDPDYKFIDECYDPRKNYETTPQYFLRGLIKKGKVVRSPIKHYDAFIFVAVNYGRVHVVDDQFVTSLLKAYKEDPWVADQFMVLDTDGDVMSGYNKEVK